MMEQKENKVKMTVKTTMVSAAIVRASRLELRLCRLQLGQRLSLRRFSRLPGKRNAQNRL
jgi:hypothetical protein